MRGPERCWSVKMSWKPRILETWVFTEIGPVELKGIAEPLRLHTARRRV